MYDEEEESIDVSDIVIDYMKKGDDAEEIDSEISSDESTSEYSELTYNATLHHYVVPPQISK